MTVYLSRKSNVLMDIIMFLFSTGPEIENEKNKGRKTEKEGRKDYLL